MLRRLLVVGFTTIVIAGCGSGSATTAPAASPVASPSDAPIVTPTETTTEAPIVEPTPADATTTTAACNAVGIRKLPSSSGALIVRVAAGTEVRVVETVVGDAYKVGNCGTAGETWLKIDQVGGEGVQDLYGVTFAYAAAGFFR
jgi:hypothetical protein